MAPTSKIAILLFTALTSVALAKNSEPLGGGTAHVVLVQGEVYAQKGFIEFSRLTPGQNVRMGFNHRYMGGSPDPIRVVVDPGPEKDRLEVETSPLYRGSPVPLLPKPLRSSPVHLSDAIPELSLIATGSASYLKLKFPDNTLVDVGPESALTLENISSSTTLKRLVRIKVAFGKVRVHSSMPVFSSKEFQIETANTVTSLRRASENELLVVSRFEKGPTSITEVTTLKGFTAVDYPLYTKDGLVFYQTAILKHLQKIQVSGPHGFGTEVQQTALKDAGSIREVVTASSPKVNAHATAVLQRPTATQLPGTFVLPTKTPPPPMKKLERVRQPSCPQQMGVALWSEC